MRVNYGRQEFYRRHGTEPACGSCANFGPKDEPRDPLAPQWCRLKEWHVAPGDICTSYERAPGADDEQSSPKLA